MRVSPCQSSSVLVTIYEFGSLRAISHARPGIILAISYDPRSSIVFAIFLLYLPFDILCYVNRVAFGICHLAFRITRH